MHPNVSPDWSAGLGHRLGGSRPEECTFTGQDVIDMREARSRGLDPCPHCFEDGYETYSLKAQLEDMTVEDVEEAVKEGKFDDLEAVKEAEEEGQDRKGVHKALDTE